MGRPPPLGSMKPASWSWSWWWPPRQLSFLLLASVVAGFLVSRSGCSTIPGDSGAAQGPQAPRALPAGAGEGAASFATGQGSDGSFPFDKGPGSRVVLSTLPDKHDTAVVAFSDGTIYLVDGTSGTVYGSFSTGSPLSVSYQAFSDHDTTTDSGPEPGELQDPSSLSANRYFISCGDDWNLYEHSAEYGKRRIEMTVEDYVKSTPRISMHGGVTLGSKRSTMFFIDAKTGKIISSHWPADIQQAVEIDNQEDKSVLSKLDTLDWVELSPAAIPPVLITRTDYVLNHVMNSSNLLWGLTVSVIEAHSCHRSRDDLSLRKGNELGLEYQGDMGQCSIMVPVHRINGIDPIKHGLAPFPRILLPENPKLPALPPNHHSDGHIEHNHEFSGIKNVENPQNFPSVLDGSQISISRAEKSREVNSSYWGHIHDKIIPAVKPQVVNRYFSWFLIPLFLILPLLYYLKVGIQDKSDETSSSLPEKQSVVSKKRKARKAGKNYGSVTRIVSHTLTEKEYASNGLKQDRRNEKDELMSFMRVDEHGEGRWIGKLFLSTTEIAKGSNGTVVLEGVYGGRPVAVKRLVRAHHDVAFKEIQNLMASDRHPNIIRWFGVEHDLDFIYLSLERCTCSLNDLIQLYSVSLATPAPMKCLIQDSENEFKVRLDIMKGINKGVELWKPNGCPSSQLLKLMRDVVSGLAHLHELGIIHRDIKPQNVLISIDRCLSAKLSDMGISKRLTEDMSSLGHHTTGGGSSGWQAPEQLLHGRQTRAIDLFSLGCVFFFCITRGKHPFGSYFERDSNILNNRMDLFLVEHIPEAVHLFSLLLNPDPERRLKALEVLQHPIFWSSEKRLSFLRDASDRVELEDRENESELLKALESIGPVAFGGEWGEKLDTPFITDMGRYRKYKFYCTRDLLRVIRNKLNHYRELSNELQELLGTVPEGFDSYFTIRFPRLIIEVYKVMHRHCLEDASFKKYFKSTFS